MKHEVLIAGGGPTGMMLAAELALGGIDVAIIERRTTPDRVGSRAGGLHVRTTELFDQRGIAERFIAEGTKYPVVLFHIPLDMRDLPSRHNYVLGLWQIHTERILGEWLAELPVTVYRGREVTGFTQDDSGVDVSLADGDVMRAQYLVGCDGGRSVVRKTAGIDFPGWDATTTWLIAELETTEEPKWGFHETALGRHAIGKGDGDAVRMVVIVENPPEAEPTLPDVSNALIAAYGTDFGAHSPKWVSRFTDMTRQTASYRDRRVLLAGDAAHIHAPMGGQGLNLGVHDAVNLGWKLAQVIRDTSPDSLLDTYHAERHPAGARALRHTMAQVALARTDERSKALIEIVSRLAAMDEPRRYLSAEIAGLNVHYDLGGDNPLVGHRIPDLDLQTDGGPTRVYMLLHDARPLLLDFVNEHAFDITPWSGRVRSVDARVEGEWKLPDVGVVPAPGAVLVRPDGYVAWAGTVTDPSLVVALNFWFGSKKN